MPLLRPFESVPVRRPFEPIPGVVVAPLGVLSAATRVSTSPGVPVPGSAFLGVADEALPLRRVVPHSSDLLTPFQEVVPGPVGGRLTNFVQSWRSVTSDAFLLSVVTHDFLISLTPGVLRGYTGFPT